MYNNGTVSNNIKYMDICKSDTFIVTSTYYPLPGTFEIVNNTMVEWYDFWYLLNDRSMIVYNFEILKPFIQNNNIIVNWTNASTFGMFLEQVNN